MFVASDDEMTVGVSLYSWHPTTEGVSLYYATSTNKHVYTKKVEENKYSSLTRFWEWVETRELFVQAGKQLTLLNPFHAMAIF